MNEIQLNKKIRVLVDDEEIILRRFHWRDSMNRRLCDRTKGGTLMAYGEISNTHWECPKCRDVVEIMAKGW